MPSSEKYLGKIEELHTRFEANLKVGKIYAASVSTKAKIPFKALVIRETLFYRITNLAGISVKLHKEHNIVASLILTRSIVEVTALCFYVYKHLNEVVEGKKIGKLDSILMRCYGTKVDTEDVFHPINVLTTIKQMDKEFSGLKEMYDFLSEFAHPNWMGCHGSYAELDRQNRCVEFFPDNRHIPLNTGLRELYAALSVFDGIYNKYGDLMKDLIILCEQDIDIRMDKFNLLKNNIRSPLTLKLFYDYTQEQHWAICFDPDNKIDSACAIDGMEHPVLSKNKNDYLNKKLENKDKSIIPE